jgi:hypothetical protein
MTTTLEDHLAARKAHQADVGQKLCEILDLISEGQSDGLTAELAQVWLIAEVNAKVLCAALEPEPEEEPEAPVEQA